MLHETWLLLHAAWLLLHGFWLLLHAFQARFLAFAARPPPAAGLWRTPLNGPHAPANYGPAVYLYFRAPFSTTRSRGRPLHGKNDGRRARCGP
jgi:hypothetical protein